MVKNVFSPWVRKIPWRREWQPIPVFLPEKSHGQRGPVGYKSWSHNARLSNQRFHFHDQFQPLLCAMGNFISDTLGFSSARWGALSWCHNAASQFSGPHLVPRMGMRHGERKATLPSPCLSVMATLKSASSVSFLIPGCCGLNCDPQQQQQQNV